MTPKAKNALKGSINKWIKIVQGTGIDEGTDNCPLCAVYHNDFDEKVKDLDCKGCPVKNFTGKKYCALTPYLDDWDNSDPGSDVEMAAAVKELRFLQFLLPNANR